MLDDNSGVGCDCSFWVLSGPCGVESTLSAVGRKVLHFGSAMDWGVASFVFETTIRLVVVNNYYIQQGLE